MSNGVAHFSIPGASAKPGEIGNFVVSGHSAGNIYQQSDYKFIFSGLTRMGGGDLIYMDYNGQRYTYRVLGTKTVDPSDVGALKKITADHSGKPMITLITCTPLGTSKYRLLVYGEQIYPSYEGAPDDTETPVEDDGATMEMPRNDGSPLEQFFNWLFGGGN
jgi:sortase A